MYIYTLSIAQYKYKIAFNKNIQDDKVNIYGNVLQWHKVQQLIYNVYTTR